MEREDGRTATGWRAGGQAGEHSGCGGGRGETHMWRPSVRPNIRDRLFLVPVLHLRSLSPAGSTSAAAPPDALPLPLALGRSIHPPYCCPASVSYILSSGKQRRRRVRTDGRRPRRWEEESHFSYCFIIRVVNDGVVDTAREEGEGEANRGEERRRAKFHKHVQLIPRDIRARIGS